MLNKIKTWWKSDFSGSTVALIFGWLILVSGLAQLSQTQKSSNLLTGVVMLLGVFAYRSAKRRKLRIKKNGWLRKTVEIILLIIMVGVILIRRDALDQIYDNPISGIVAPLWVLIAYVVVCAKKYKDDKDLLLINTTR